MNTNFNDNVVEISLGGEKREIASYDLIMKYQLMNQDTEIITPFQYQTCIFNNMGFIKCPANSYWMKQRIDMELSDQTEMFDQPMPKIPMIILGKDLKLSFLLDLIKVWAKGEVKNGHLINLEKSFSNKRDYEFCLKNNLQMKIGYTIEQEIGSWDSSDVVVERLHQLNPIVDKDYFENCLCNFEAISKVTTVQYPYVMFALGIINPDIVMSVIKQAEMDTAKEITTKEFNGIQNMTAQSPNALPLFQNKLNELLGECNKIYSKYGIRGLIILNRIYKRGDKIDKDQLVQESIKEKMMYGRDLVEKEQANTSFVDIGNLELFDGLPNGEAKESFVITQETTSYNNSDNKGRERKRYEINSVNHFENVIKKYVFDRVDDETKFPEVIDLKHRNENSYEYKKTLFRLYVLLKYIVDPKYGKVLEGDKLVLSNNFYIDYSNFALYIPSMNLYMYVDRDYNVDFMTPSEIVKYYNNKFGGNHFIDIEEIDGSAELDEIKELKIPSNFDLIMSNDTYYKDGKNEVDLDIQPTAVVPQQVTQPQIVFRKMVPEGFVDPNPEEPMFGLDPASLVIN